MELQRTDFYQVNGTSRGVLAFLPNPSRQPLAVGDTSGALSLLNLDPNQSMSLWTHSMRPISSLDNLYASSSLTESIYVATGSYLNLFSNTGRQVSQIDTCMTENITTFKAVDSQVFVAGKYLYSRFVEGKDVDYLILSDLINDLSYFQSSAILACQDKTIRMLSESSTTFSYPLSSIPISILSHGSSLTYATSDGGLGGISISSSPKQLWTFKHEAREPSSICLYDLLGNGRPQIIVGRSDGTFELFRFQEEAQGEITLEADYKVSEAITSCVGGKARGTEEIVCSTFSGKILGITSPNSPLQQVSQSKHMQNEIDILKVQLEEAKRAPPKASIEPSNQSVSYKVHLLGSEAAYLLVIESQSALSTLCLVSDVQIDILNSQDINASVNVITREKQVSVIYSFPDSSSNRAEIKFRSTEGHSGLLKVYVVPVHKTGTLLSVELKPLSLHEKIPNFDQSEYLLNRLQITGKFTKSEIHGWLSQALPDIPPHVQDERVVLSFSSSVLGTVLQTIYTNNFAEFCSESVSIIAILKESVSQHASFRKIHLDIAFFENPQSHSYVLELIDAQMSELQQLETQIQLLDALSELKNSGELNNFSEEFQDILANKEDIVERAAKSPQKLQFLQGVISDLFVDMCKFRGFHGVSTKIPELQHILANYSFESLLEFFKG